jgi:hypothetical protein
MSPSCINICNICLVEGMNIAEVRLNIFVSQGEEIRELRLYCSLKICTHYIDIQRLMKRAFFPAYEILYVFYVNSMFVLNVFFHVYVCMLWIYEIIFQLQE